MSDFDPYYTWLGIPPKDQLPHHYRLLGIEILKVNADVIATAAPSLADASAEISPEEDAAFQKMLAKQPDDHYQSMDEVVTALTST